MDINNILFTIICLFHILIWLFVLIAFIDIRTAKINLYIIVPLIYILHILPFHILVESKKKLNEDNWEEDAKKIEKKLIIPYYFIKLMKSLKKYCFFSPISPQGMLLFGMISSSYRLYFYNKDCIKPKLKKIERNLNDWNK
jgi:hypothetical protein